MPTLPATSTSEEVSFPSRYNPGRSWIMTAMEVVDKFLGLSDDDFPKIEVLELPKATPDLPPLVFLEDIGPRQCHFPCENLQCCGRPTKSGSAYCQHHYSIIYVPYKPKRPGNRAQDYLGGFMGTKKQQNDKRYKLKVGRRK